MKHKALAFIASLALILSLATPAFAESGTGTGTGIGGAITPAGNGSYVTRAYVIAELSAIAAQLQSLIQQASSAGLLGSQNTLGGDFAGGIVPNQLWTPNVSANSVTPVLSNLTVPGNITETSPAALNIFPGTTVMNDWIWSEAGFSNSFSTSTAITTNIFCNTTNQQWINTTALATSTLAAATSSYLACGSPNFGAINYNHITNDSSNTVNIAAGTGETFRCLNQAVGTTTQASGSSCTASQFSLPASSSVYMQGWWEASGTMIIDVGPSFH